MEETLKIRSKNLYRREVERNGWGLSYNLYGKGRWKNKISIHCGENFFVNNWCKDNFCFQKKLLGRAKKDIEWLFSAATCSY